MPIANAARFALGRILVPLLLIATFVFPYVGGAGWAYLLIVATLLATALHLALFRSFDTDISGLLFVTAFALLFAVYAFTSRPDSSDLLFAFNFAMLLFFVPLRAIFGRHAKPGNVLLVARLALAGTVLAAAVALMQTNFLGYARAEGYGSNPIPSSTVALLLGFLALMGLVIEPGRRRYIYILGPLLGVFVIFLAGSRGPLLGAGALLAVSLVVLPKHRGFGVAALAAIVAVGLAVLLLPEHLGRFGRLLPMLGELISGQPVTSDTSGNIRYRILDGSLRAFLDSPWVGYGWAAKTAVVDSYLAAPVFGPLPRYHLHSDLLDFAISGGVVGLLAYVLILAAPWIGVLRSPRDRQYEARLYGVVVLVVGYLACGAVNLLFGFEYLTTFYVLAAATLIGFCRDQVTSGSGR